jgi:hypothetical protein
VGPASYGGQTKKGSRRVFDFDPTQYVLIISFHGVLEEVFVLGTDRISVLARL